MARDKTSSYEATLCAFGKHPGWNDHMQSFGLETNVLVSFHKDVYQQGVGSNIGAWAEIAKRNKKELLPFNHHFIWQKNQDTILGRMWHSQDGKGRSLYPMVTCVHSRTIPLSVLLKEIHPLLLAAEKNFIATSSASEVMSLFKDAKEQIDDRVNYLKSVPLSVENLTPFRAYEKLKILNPGQCNLNGFSRIFFVIQNNLSIKSGSTVATASAPIFPIRISFDCDMFEDAAVMWTTFFSSQLKGSTPRLYLFPSKFPWCDIIIGQPMVKEYSSIKLPLENIPLISDDNSIVVDEEFVRQLDENLIGIYKNGHETLPRFMKTGRRSRESEIAHDPMKIKGLIADSLKEKKEAIDKHLLKKIFGAVSLILVLIVCIVFIVIKQEPVEFLSTFDTPPKPKELPPQIEQQVPTFDPQVWKNLCLEYHTWFASFYNDLNGKKREKWSGDEELQKILELLENASASGKKIDPIQIAGIKGNYRFLAENPPTNTLTKDVQRQIEDAENLVKQIKQTLRTKQENVQKFINNLYQRIDMLGWREPLKVLNLLREKIQRNEQTLSAAISSILDNYFEVKDNLEKIDKLSYEVETRLNVIRGSGDTILGKIDKYVELQFYDIKDLDEFTNKLNILTGVDHIVTKLAAFIERQWNTNLINIELFQSKSKVHSYFDEDIDESILAAWLKEVHDYAWLDTETILTAKDIWQQDLERLYEEIRELSENDSKKAQSFSERLSPLKLKTELNVPYIKKNQAKLDSLIETVNGEIKNLMQAVELERITRSEDPCDWMRNMTSFEFEYSLSLQENWMAKRDQLLAEITCETLNNNPNQYAQIRIKGDGLQHFLIELDRIFPRTISANVLEPKRWHTEFFNLIKIEREQALAKILSTITWKESIPETEFQEFIQQSNQALLHGKYLDWLEIMARIFTDFQLIENKLELGYLLDEKIQYNETESTINSLFRTWIESEFFVQNSRFETVLDPVVSRVAQIQMIANEQDIKRLTTYALDSKNTFVETYASWNRLGRMDWPINSQHRGEMKKISMYLETLANTIDDTDRIHELKDLLDQEKIVYELRYFNVTIDTTIKAIESEISQLDENNSDNLEQIESIKKELAEVIKLKNNTVNDLRNRNPTKKDITSTGKLLIQFYQLKKKVDNAKDPWIEIQKLEKINEISSTNTTINDVWRVWRNQTLNELEKEQVGKISKNALQVKMKLEKAVELLGKLASDSDFNTECSLKTSELPNAQWRADIEDIINDKRKAIILENLDDGDSTMDTIKTTFASWRQSLCELALDFYEFAQGLNSGFSLRTKWANGTTDTRFETLRIQLSSFNELRKVVGNIENRVKKLRAIDKVGGRELWQQVKDHKIEPEIQMTLWEKTRLLHNWPKSVNELKYEVSLRQRIEKLVPAIKTMDSKFANQIAKELNEEKENRWVICMEQLTSDLDIEEILALKDQFLSGDTTKLSPKIQYNIWLYDLKHAKLENSTDEKITAICRHFFKQLESQAQLKKIIEVSDFLGELESAISGERRSLDHQLDGIGPASSLVGNELNMQVLNNGEYIEYRWANDAFGENAFGFIRVETKNDAVNPFYLCSSEASFGLFKQVMTRADKWDAIQVFISDDASDPYRQGPWLWDDDGQDHKISLRKEWVNVPTLPNNADYYPHGEYPKSPTEAHPMHYISPQMAVYFSSLLHCRIPSPEEWKTACKLVLNNKRRNLRDQTWEAHKQHITKLEQKGKSIFYTDSNIFWPSNWGQRSRNTGKNARSHDKLNDKTLWFHHASSFKNAGFSDLIGNMAEYVFKDSGLFDKEFNKNSNITPQKVIEFIEKHAANFFVIGGSALSPPRLDVSRPYPLNVSDQRSGYSDVGLRLAFTAPLLTLSAQVKAIVQKQRYLLN